jgi:GNAT superfamily N-acetyltransferase
LGFEKTAEEDVMVRESEVREHEIEAITDTEEWARVLSLSFFGEVNGMGLLLGDCMQRFESALSVGIRDQGALVAAAQLCVLDNAGLLCGDGTLESHRGRGLQQKLILGRVDLAHRRNLRWVHSEVQPGSTSQRNYLRCGFERAYPRVHYVRHLSKV